MSSQGFKGCKLSHKNRWKFQIKAKNKCFIDSECTGPVSKIVATF